MSPTTMRTLDASLLTQIIRSNPMIAEAVFDEPEINYQDAVDCVYSVILLDNREDAAAIFHWSSPNIWQSHTVFAASCRGRRAIDTAIQMIAEMFLEWDAEELWGQTPINNRAAHWFNRQIGAVYCGQDVHHHTGDVLTFRIKREAWLARFQPSIRV